LLGIENEKPEMDYESVVEGSRDKGSRVEGGSKSGSKKLTKNFKKKSNSFKITFLAVIEGIVNEFNLLRSDPNGYVPKIEELIKYIQPNPEPKKNQNFIYSQEKLPKTMLLNGEVAFRDMINILKVTAPLPSFEFKQDLVIEVPENSKEWFNKDVINTLFNKKKEELRDKYQSFSFHYDIGTCIPNVSTVLQVVDDNVGFSGSRRHNLLSETFKYIGIGCAKEKTKYCFYIVFAN